MAKDKLSTESYKGVRDFYPEDKFVFDYITDTMARVSERFGYEAYDASILEPVELYRGKTSEEIVNEQTYTFTDRGGREVTLRPEMTPSVARMVAARQRELAFPLRWFSIPNVFRYERPQKGRLREHWQLNADLFGVSSIDAEVEMITLAHAIMTEFGAQERDFEIRVNDRNIFENMFNELHIDPPKRKEVMWLLDRRNKVDDFDKRLLDILGNEAKKLADLLDRAMSNPVLEALRQKLAESGVKNVVVDTTIVRGFDYYTGIVFEVFDASPLNNRSLFGGGRYDNLLEVFGKEPMPAVGFGMGDVTVRDFLEVHDLLPEYVPATDIMLCILEEQAVPFAEKIAQQLRKEDINVAINYSLKKAGEQIKAADKKRIPFVACIGAKEMESKKITVKHLPTRTDKELGAGAIADFVFEFTE
jgi:histidyl-tRNA synthetase